MKAWNITLSATALLALAACDKGAENSTQTPEEVTEAASQIKLTPGQWEITQETLSQEVKGASGPMAEAMKHGAGRKLTISHCMTPEDVEQSHGGFMAAQKEMKCTYDNYRMTGGVVSGSVACDNVAGGKMRSTVNGVYTPDSYEMTLASTMEGMQGMTMTTKMKMTAKRVGECTSQPGEGTTKVDN